MTTRPPLALVGALALSTACAGLQPQVADLPLPDQRLASIGSLGARSNFEIRTLYSAPEQPPPADQPAPARKRAVTPILFTLGVIGAAVLGGAAIGTGAASFGLRRKLDNSYFDDGGLSLDEYTRIKTNGERLSDATWGLGLASFAFAAMALISYAVDWQRCGPLAPKRRRIAAPAGRCEEFGGRSGPQ